jgi:ribosomal protein S2
MNKVNVSSHFLNVLFSLGVHIGHLKIITPPSNHFFLLGDRHQIEVLDIKLIVYSLRNTSSFFYELGKINADLLFHITSLHRYDLNLKFFFVHLITVLYKHRFFDEKWSFGQFSNFRTHALQIMYRLFFTEHRSFKFYNNIKSRFRFKRHLVWSRRKKRIRTFKKQTKLRVFFSLQSVTFIDLLVRVIFYSYLKRIEGVSFELHFSNVLKFFKFVLLFKYFRNFLIMPDAFVLNNPDRLHSPIVELSGYRIPVVSLVDSNSHFYGISYPVYSNDDNIILVIFYFKLFLKIYSWGKIDSFLRHIRGERSIVF